MKKVIKSVKPTRNVDKICSALDRVLQNMYSEEVIDRLEYHQDTEDNENYNWNISDSGNDFTLSFNKNTGEILKICNWG